MYSYADRLRAVELYIRLGKRLNATIRQSDYPTKNAWRGWYREYVQHLDLRPQPVRAPEYFEAQKQAALEQRSAQAARHIKALISASNEHVDQRVTLVAETGGALDRIAEQVQAIDSLMPQISRATGELASGLREFNTAVNHVDQARQQNAAMIEETTTASTVLNGKANTLSQMISRFVVGRSKTSGDRRAGWKTRFQQGS